MRARVSYGVVSEKEKKASIFTGDELHYVSVPNSDWRVALWRYLPCAESVKRNHPLLLLSGVATNAVGYDLSPQVSFSFHFCLIMHLFLPIYILGLSFI